MKKLLKIISGTLGILLLVCVLIIGFFIAGNPVSYILAWGSATQYIQENYADTDYKINSIEHLFPYATYRANVSSPTKQDERFSIITNGLGEIQSTNYTTWIENRYTVKWRLIDEYTEQGKKAFEGEILNEKERLDFSLNFLENGKPFIGKDYFKAHPNANHLKDLPLNTATCTKEIARVNGVINYRETVDGTPTYEEIAKNLLRIKSTANEAGFAFHAIDYTLKNSQDMQDVIYVGYIYYEDIYEEGLIERIQQREAEYRAYIDNLIKGE